MRFSRYVKINNWGDSVILIIFICAFTGAFFNHAADIISKGLFPYTKMYGAPESFNLYWTSLTILDPLAVAVLFVNVRLGYLFGLCIMLTNVPVNLYANVVYWRLPILENPYFLMQATFLVFLLVTGRRIWRGAGSERKKSFEQSN